MRRSCLLATLFLCCTSFFIFSQEKGDMEIRAGVGNFSTNRIINATLSTLVVVFSAGQSYSESDYVPAIGAGFHYAVRNRWTVSIDGYYETIHTNYLTDEKIYLTDINRFITIGAGTDLHYISRDRFRMYSGIAAAFTFKKNEYERVEGEHAINYHQYINGHVNFLGFRFGNKVAGYLELGFGYRGLINAGISVRLNDRYYYTVPTTD